MGQRATHPALRTWEIGVRLELLKIALLFGIVMLAASPGWRGSFVWDDLGVVQNSEFQALPVSDFARGVMTRDFGLEVDETPLNYYRPIVLISLKLNRLFVGVENDSPAPYRAVNALIHFLNAALLYGCLRLVRLPANGRCVQSVGAFSAALIFAAAGWNAEVVSFISARCESLSLFFLLLGGFIWLQFSTETGCPVLRIAGALICFLASLMSKETAIPVIAALPVLTFVLVTEHRRRRFVEMAGAAWGALLIYVVIRTIVGIPFPSGLVLQALSTTGSVEAQALYHYLIHLAWPAGVLAREPVGLSNVTYPAGVLLAASLIGLLWTAALVIAVRLRPRLTGFSLFCASLLLFPVLLLHGKEGAYALCERFIYIPSGAMAVCGGVLIESLFRRNGARGRAVVVVGFALFLTVHVAMQVSKNRVWSEEIVFWRYQSRAVSSPAASALLYGMALKRANRLDEAEAQLMDVVRHESYPWLRIKATKALEEIRAAGLPHRNTSEPD